MSLEGVNGSAEQLAGNEFVESADYDGIFAAACLKLTFNFFYHFRTSFKIEYSLVYLSNLFPYAITQGYYRTLMPILPEKQAGSVLTVYLSSG
jgi:hypothetical protein